MGWPRRYRQSVRRRLPDPQRLRGRCVRSAIWPASRLLRRHHESVLMAGRGSRARRNAKARVGPYAALFFIAVIVGAAGLSLWIEDRYRKAEAAYRLYVADHPLKPGERPP